MTPERKRATLAGATEGALEIVKMIPGIGILIESVRKYQESIEDQQREALVARLSDRIGEIEKNAEWYKAQAGQDFVKKILATALNAEYADKLEYVTNALVNGPKFADDALREKFVEMVRRLSKPALDVLVASLKQPSASGQVDRANLAAALNWHPALVDACVQELYAEGAFSNVTDWRRNGGTWAAASEFRKGVPAVTEITRGLGAFISRHET